MKTIIALIILGLAVIKGAGALIDAGSAPIQSHIEQIEQAGQ